MALRIRIGIFLPRHWIAGFVIAGALAGCAAPRVVSESPQAIWLDQAFDFRPEWVSIQGKELFALDPSLLAELHNEKLQRASVDTRVNFIVSTLVENKKQPFTYTSGHSTVAAQTWRNRSGDCLSLTVLAYAMAKELKLPVTMQEIPGTMLFDRRGANDYRVGHVNLFVDRPVSGDLPFSTSLRRGTVIDFEPVYGATRHGTALTQSNILARYYNNVGAEYWARNDLPRAYAYFKAALRVDPDFSGAPANLAGLYWQEGHPRETEAVLTWAVSSTDRPIAAVRALHRLLTLQSRPQEAANYQRMMEKLQEEEPYYWIERGVAQLKAREYRRAVASLEKAQSLSTGFSEVHRYLAMAYVLDGEPDKAQEQLSALARINSEDPSLSAIQRKIAAARKAGAHVGLNTNS